MHNNSTAILSVKRGSGTVAVPPAATRLIYTDATTNGILEVNHGRSYAASLTAFAGGGQGSATALISEINHIGICATAGDSVKLLAASPGLIQRIINRGPQPAMYSQTPAGIWVLGQIQPYHLQPGLVLHMHATVQQDGIKFDVVCLGSDHALMGLMFFPLLCAAFTYWPAPICAPMLTTNKTTSLIFIFTPQTHQLN